MYTTQILQYLIFPVFLVISWYIIKNALLWYEKKFPEKDETTEKLL